MSNWFGIIFSAFDGYFAATDIISIQLLQLFSMVWFKVTSTDSNCDAASETCTDTLVARGINKEQHNENNNLGSKFVSI